MHTPNFSLRRGRRAVHHALALSLATVALAGCSDPFKLKASYANEPFAFTLYALSGKGPANAPSALDLTARSVVRVDGNFAFDVAFDMDGKGKVVVLPQRFVGTPVSGGRTVALQRLSGGFDAVLLAPLGGWLTDSVMTVLPGEVVGVRLTSSSCVYQISSELYVKFVVDSTTSSGLVFGRGVFNPNCGFRSLAEGVPDK